MRGTSYSAVGHIVFENSRHLEKIVSMIEDFSGMRKTR